MKNMTEYTWKEAELMGAMADDTINIDDVLEDIELSELLDNFTEE